MPVALVIPVKRLDRAKGRLGLPPPERATVALQLVRHTVDVVTQCTSVDLVTVVTEDRTVAGLARSAGAVVTPEPGSPGLVAAALEGRRTCRLLAPDHDVAVMVSDLPHLSAADLDSLLHQFSALGAPMFVADHLGTGTTALVHPRDDEPPIRFGHRSARRHREAGYAAAEGPLRGLRQDLDTTEDLLTIRTVTHAAAPA